MHKVSHNGERILPVYRQFPAPEGQVGFIGQRACSVILLSVTGSYYDILRWFLQVRWWTYSDGVSVWAALGQTTADGRVPGTVPWLNIQGMQIGLLTGN